MDPHNPRPVVDSDSSAGPAANARPARVRSRVACQGCNRRKVRCDVTQTGLPCSNCKIESKACEVLPRKKHRPRRPRLVPQPASEPAKGHDEPNNVTGRLESASSGANGSSVTSQALGNSAQSEALPNHIPHLGSRAEHVPGEFASRPATPEADGILPDDDASSYIGDRRGPRSSVYDLCHPKAPQDRRQPQPQRPTNVSWKRHEIEYLRHKGAFQIPPKSTCDALIRCYFEHVHFFLPIIDASEFFKLYDNDWRSISPLLYWSMFLATANFVKSDVLDEAGFSSRKEMKAAMYDRAKCLYDLNRSTDKLTLIQSVMLMGFWYTDAHDHTGAWYWIGIAISLSQSLGFHRAPQDTHRSQRPQEAHQRLIRRIWWTCVVRDCWVSLAKGRPMRIHDEDCDVPLPHANDLLHEFAQVSTAAREKFLPSEIQRESLAKLWIRLAKISGLLGQILRSHYRVKGPKPSLEDIDRYALELQSCAAREESAHPTDDHLLLHEHQHELFYQATVAILYRPYVLNAPASLPLQATDQWQTTITRKARAAASNTNSILEKIVELKAVHLLKPMIITALVPAMQIHLWDCKSSDPLLSSLGSGKLHLCMVILSTIRDTYWSASVIYRLFERAQVILRDSSSKVPTALSTTADTRPSKSNKISRGSVQGAIGKTAPRAFAEQQQGRQQDIPKRPMQPPLSGGELDSSLAYRSNPMGSHEGQVCQMSALPPEMHQNQEQQSVTTESSWWNESPSFNSVEQLLSPGFALSEDGYQALFMGYNNVGMVPNTGNYDSIVVMPNEGLMDMY